MSIKDEKATIERMIRLYCKLNHKSKELCKDCAELNEYAQKKLSKCPFGDNKPVCKDCTVHCYSTDKKEKIREIMRFSGPRMMLYHPIDFLKHLIK